MIRKKRKTSKYSENKLKIINWFFVSELKGLPISRLFINDGGGKGGFANWRIQG